MSRSPLFLIPAAFCLIPGFVFAQADAPLTAPPEVDQALRARVNEFFQDFVERKYRQALNLVAEDTQDEYFASNKAEVVAFTLESISYSKDFADALVKLNVTQVWKMRAEGFVNDANVDAPWETTWKVENGKWVYYHHMAPEGHYTPMGLSNLKAQPPSSTGAAPAAPPKINTETMTAEGMRILQQSQAATDVNPKEVTLARDKPSSAKVVFHNGAQGSLNLSVIGLPSNLAGFSATVEKPVLNMGQDTTVNISFTPSPQDPPLPRAVNLIVDVQPFGIGYPVVVTFEQPKE